MVKPQTTIQIDSVSSKSSTVAVDSEVDFVTSRSALFKSSAIIKFEMGGFGMAHGCSEGGGGFYLNYDRDEKRQTFICLVNNKMLYFSPNKISYAGFFLRED